MRQRTANNTFVGARLQYDDRASEMAAFDALPAPLRRMLDQNASKLSAVRVTAFVADIARQANDYGEAVHYTMKRLLEIERNEVLVFAGRYRAQTLRPYPFVEAGVRIMRYGELGPSRHAPRRYRLRGLPRDVPEAA